MAKSEKKKASIFQFWSAMIMLFLIIIAAIYTERRASQSFAMTCVGNMRQIQMAKEAWAAEQSRIPDVEPTWQDIMPFLPTKGRLMCPYRKVYDLGPVSEHPRCPYGHDHVCE